MKILIVGSGGREHALAWKIAQSRRVKEVIVAPGNGGTPAQVQLESDDPAALRQFAAETKVDLTLVGPEMPLARGIVDEFQAHGLKIWGPSRAAAQLETSKAWAKAFMVRHKIPTGAYASFTDFEAAQAHLLKQEAPVVIKASGLAAGKGVVLPQTRAEAETVLRQMMLEKQFGEAGDEVIIEEWLTGSEVSVLAFCDGSTARVMPPAQDHKRIFDRDQGPNTGGMGAYAPAPICSPELLHQIETTVLQPAIEGMQQEGSPYVGVLYAGVILTPRGPKVLEFNCRFGDPEAQVLLPLLKTDLLKIIERSLTGKLSSLDIDWETGAAATVVLASQGYPGAYEKGKPITGLAEAAGQEGVLLFHAGTKLAEDGQIITDGGRVLSVTGVASELPQALERAYAGVNQIQFEGRHYRTDIGRRALT
jgi:phosphoribosylamine--glycine ligase